MLPSNQMVIILSLQITKIKKTMNCFTKKSGKGCGRIKSVVFGLLVIALGMILIYDNMGLLSPFWKQILISWQMLLVAMGFINVFGRSSRIFGIILILVGGFFILPNFMDLPENFTQTFWPLLVVIAGILIVFVSVTRLKKIGHVKQSDNDNYIEDVLIFGGAERVFSSDEFRGGKSINIFGGSSYNLSRCSLADGTHILELVCVFGGTKIVVPPTWNVKIEIVSVLGGFEDKRHISEDAGKDNKTLIIKGVAVFGGGEISSF
jgi:predicted membrane protein